MSSPDIGARVYRTANQSIPTGVLTAISYDNERWDTDGMHSNVVNPSRLTAQTEGYYYITESCRFEGVASGAVRQTLISVNGVTVAANWIYPTSTLNALCKNSTLYYLTVGQYVEHFVYHDRVAAALNILPGGNYTPELSIQMVEEVGARVYRNSDQSIPSASAQYISFSTERWDNNGIWAAGQPTRLTCQTDGVYIITANIYWQANANGGRLVWILLNGATVIASERKNYLSAIIGSAQSIETIYRLFAGDYIELQVYQDSGIARSVLYASPWSPEFAMHKVC